MDFQKIKLGTCSHLVPDKQLTFKEAREIAQKKTFETQNEMAFNFDPDSEAPHIGKLIEGNRQECKIDREYDGMYHTHPFEPAISACEPSPSDVILGTGFKNVIDCIGLKKKDDILASYELDLRLRPNNVHLKRDIIATAGVAEKYYNTLLFLTQMNQFFEDKQFLKINLALAQLEKNVRQGWETLKAGISELQKSRK